MAIDIWTPSTAANSTLQGGMALASGVGGGIQALGDNITKAIEAQKQKGDLATALRKTLKTAYPDRKAEFDALGLPELRGVLEGETMKSISARHKQEAEANRLSVAREKQKFDSTAALPALYKDLSEMGQEPGSLPFDIAPAEFERRTRPPNLMEALARSGATVEPDDVARLQAALEAKSKSAMGPEVMKQLGFGPTGGQVNPNGTASLTFGPPPPQFSDRATPILTNDGRPTGKATFRDKTIDLSPPNSEGKTLTQSESQMLGALSQAGTDLDNLEKIFTKLGPDWGGPVSGRAKSAAGMGQNPDIAAIENAITAATPNLARGVFREVGVLTDDDIKRYKALLPTAYDTDAVRSVKMKQLRERIVQGKKETMDSLRKAGRDLSGFDKADKAEAAPQVHPGAVGKSHEQLIQEANAAISGGADETKVRARLKELGVEIK